MKTKFDKKIVAGLIVSLFSTQMMHAMAQGVSTQDPNTLASSGPSIPNLPNLTYHNPNEAPVGCNKEVMQNLNSTYVQNRMKERNLTFNTQMNGLVVTTPKANQMDCFQQAMQNIKNLMRAIDSIIAMFSGQVNMDAMMQQIVNMVLKAACQEVNQVTGSISGSLNNTTNGINGTIGQINGTQIGNGSVGTTIGGVLTSGSLPPQQQGPDIIGGSISGASNTWGTVNNTVNNAGSTTSSLVDKIQSVSPFNSGNPGK